MTPQTDTDKLDSYTERLFETAQEQYSEILNDEFNLIIYRWNGGYRLRVQPNRERTGESWESDIGPYCSTEAEFQRFLEGLTFTDAQMQSKAQLFND